METIFTLSTVIAGLMSTTTMGNASNESIRTMCFSLATASGISWLSKEAQGVFQAAGKEAYPSVPQAAIIICIILEAYILYRFLMKSKRQRGKLAKRDLVASVLLLIGIVSWVIVYQRRLFSFNHFFPELVLIPILMLLVAVIILSSHVFEENDAPKKAREKEDGVPALYHALLNENKRLHRENESLRRQLRNIKQQNAHPHLTAKARGSRKSARQGYSRR